jgi:hypothetical protein
MAAIDLLLNWSPTSERMHQVVLTGLLRHTRLLEMLGIGGMPTDLKIETQNKLYDFTVTVSDGTMCRKIHIELKVDASLGETQIRRQMASVAEGDLLVYVLIGVTRFTWSGRLLEDVRNSLEQAPHAGSVRIIGLTEMREAISALAAHAVDENHRDLAVAYGSLLRKIHDATSEFENKPLSDWKRCGSEWFGLFSEIVRRLDLRDAEMNFVYNPGGGFIGCWWNFLALDLAPGCGAYLQCEEHLLCFKIAVEEGDRATLRSSFSEAVLNAARLFGFTAKKPDRFGNGTYMTVAVMEGDYRAGPTANLLDWDHVIQRLNEARSVLERAVQTYRSGDAT